MRDVANTHKDVEMCEKLGISYGTLDNWKARDSIPLKRLKQIAKENNVSYAWLESGEGEKNAEAESKMMVNDIAVEYGSSSASIPVLDVKVSAGSGNNVDSIDDFSVSRRLSVDASLFHGGVEGIRAVQVDGHSMVPVLLPDSFVFFRETDSWSGDGLYVLVFRGVLMVKLVEADPKTGNLWVKSANKDYESWEYDPTEDQSTMQIVGRVVRVLL